MTNVLIIVSGASSAMFTPYNLNWAKIAYSNFNFKVLLTSSAEQFVTRAALSQILGEQAVLQDQWTDPSRSIHVELARWAHGVVVSPATFNFINSFVTGIGDRPSLLTLHALSGPKVFTPSFPPGIEPEPWLTSLRSMPRTDVASFVQARSSGTGQIEQTGSAPLMTGLQLLKDRLSQ